jgi:hypothetical protein
MARPRAHATAASAGRCWEWGGLLGGAWLATM